MNRHLHLVREALNLYARHTRRAQITLDHATDGNIFLEQVAVVAALGVPPGVPVADRLQPKAYWMYFASQLVPPQRIRIYGIR